MIYTEVTGTNFPTHSGAVAVNACLGDPGHPNIGGIPHHMCEETG